ncbi:hypothetical protein I3843_05G021100 [Carya illinoinensis]|uniref:Uncharacterized protein n=1 Tax=Carya illinoinensis TaxID=32201 RepID=A0A8T1QEG8_CARIL|nr:protein SHORT HYPOCOTYL IN WHITE LIGHT 1 [Carya illinoinensis]KAG2704787.1 hypothetical protein I3760_05G021400 [Carya illinoinensis]KAG6652652.1 hypothetical protein CIPAW_05G021000 [Carya illinoinensis]KAG7977239.1 hypothetical protein I3843_05G021100 [Carya illinoinensis]
MSFSVTLSSPLSLSSFTQSPRSEFLSNSSLKFSLRQFHSFHKLPLLQASRRASKFPQGSEGIIDDTRNWSRSISPEFDDDEDDDDDADEDEDRSLDLLVRFIENMFKKISRRARKAVRSVLPVPISAKLVGFSVNGVLLLAFLWVLKAFLEVVCTLGSVVFVCILLIRGLWTGVTYLQESRYQKVNEFDDDRRAWTGSQPAT